MTKVAQQDHELGNHSINHACRGSLPNRECVSEQNDLDKKYFAEIIQEVQTANSFLKAIYWVDTYRNINLYIKKNTN